LATILKAHEFPATVVKFNPSGNLVVSGSPDNSIRVVTIPAHISSGVGTFVFILAVVLVILAILVQLYLKA
jgi:prolactin regulatory element-binding protein